MTIGSKITWAGDYSNEARIGRISAINGGMVTVFWSNGTQAVLPAFTMTGAKWKVGG